MKKYGIAEVDTLVGEFSDCSLKAKQQANDILKQISEGCVPCKEIKDAFNNSILYLQKRYDTIFELAEKILSADELPESNSSIELYAFAIAENKRKALESQISVARSVLQRFISVNSYIETYALALLPFQKQAETLLNEIENGKTDKLSNSNIFDSSQCFLRALAAKNFESQIGLQLLDNIGKFYPRTVERGLTREQYYLEENEAMKDQIVTPIVLQETHDSQSEEKMNPQIDSKIVEAEIAEEIPETQTPLAQEIGKKTKSISIINEEKVLVPQNKVKKATPSATAFKKEVVKYPEEAQTILPLLTNLGALTDEQLFDFGVVMDCFTNDDIAKQSMNQCLEFLTNKGLLSSFIFTSEHKTAYCLSSYAYGCLKKDTIVNGMKEFFSVSLGKNALIADDQVSEAKLVNVISYNDLLLNYFLGIKGSLSQSDYKSARILSGISDNLYKVVVYYKKEKHECILYNPYIDMLNCDNLLISDKRFQESALPKCEKLFIYSNGKVYLLGDSEESSEDPINSNNNESIVTEKKTTEKECVNFNSTVEPAVFEEPLVEEIPTILDTESDMDSSKNKSSPTEQKDISLEELTDMSKTPSDAVFVHLVEKILDGKMNSKGTYSDVMRATMLAQSASFYPQNAQSKKLFQKLLAATKLPFSDMMYTSEFLSPIFAECEDECLILAGYMQALLVPGMAYDYGLNQQADTYFRSFDTIFPSLSVVKPLFSKLLGIHQVIPSGFTASVLALVGNATENKLYIERLQHQAKDLFTIPNIKTRIRTLPKLYNDCFGNNSDLYYCMSIIAKNDVNECELVKEVLSCFCIVQNGEFTISDEKTENFLDKAWRADNGFELAFDARALALRQFYSRLNVMKDWVEHVSKASGGTVDVNRINVLKKEIVNQAEDVIVSLRGVEVKYIPVLIWTLHYIATYLTNAINTNEVFNEFLLTGIFSVNQDGIPRVDKAMANIKYYEPWRNLFRHILSPISDYNKAKEEILSFNSPLFDNLHQQEMIETKECAFGMKIELTDSQLKDARSSAEVRTTKFKENLELAYTYNRISELEKERLAAIMEQYKPAFFQNKDFGCWSQFLNALEREIDELATEKKKALRRELDARKATLQADENSTILKEAEMLLERDMNFAVTEEYLNRFDNGEKEFSEELTSILHDKDSFTDFLSDEKFLPLQRECDRCSGKSLRFFAWKYLESRISRDWTSRQREDSRKLVENWPIRKGGTQTSAISAIFSGFGFHVINVVKDNDSKEEYFQVAIEPTAKSMADYRHPISLFGTQMKTPLNVIVLYGNYAPKQLVDTICSMDFGGMSVVLIDRPIDRAARRQIGEIFHTQTSGQNPFLLIDQILFLYLSMHQVTERLPVLLKCTLPYTTYQPFVRDGGSTTDEMFCGRTRELSTIIDPNGACVVYGGRQLGKTALLQRAESRCYKPDTRDYAIYCNIIECGTPKELVKKLVDDINRKTNLQMPSSETIDDFCRQIDKMFRSSKVNSMLLLIDEADKFLSNISYLRYKPLQAFIDLKRETTNRFKFVLAGLHNVCRAKNATIDNGVFGQLGTPLCVKPLSPTDALQLLSRPLKYLGFQIDRYPHLETILTNTNYYPGILQFFGYMLVQEFTSQYGKYYHASEGHPPFTLKDEQLGTVMNSADLNRSIKDKFRWSLELDQRYFMIARCITILYYLRNETKENWLGFSVDEIMAMAEEYKIHCLENSNRSDYLNLLDEMVEMGILSRPTLGLYRLRRNSFVNIIGSDFDVLDEEIVTNNTEVTA